METSIEEDIRKAILSGTTVEIEIPFLRLVSNYFITKD